MQLQQGDITFEKVESIPKGAVQKKHNGLIVLAEGESTGHRHVCVCKSAIAEVYELKEQDMPIPWLFLRLAEPVTVTHEEHKPIQLDPGLWKVGRIREYDYIQQMERQVID